MGNLKPGASYSYEYENNSVYAREAGSNERQQIGYKYDSYMENIAIDYELETVWKDIIQESRTNPALQKALDHVKILYHLSKDYGKK